MTVSQYFKGLFQGIGSLIKGMRVTLIELFTKKVTQQYPENRATLVMTDRFMGELTMPHDENNEHACTGCGICQMNCPNGTITVKTLTIETEDGKKKKILDQHIYNLGSCTFCNLCVLTCPQDAIEFNKVFESSVFTRDKLVMQLNHEGSQLREKKKPADAAKAVELKEKTAVAKTEKAAVDEEKKASEKEVKLDATDVPVKKDVVIGLTKEEKATLAENPITDAPVQESQTEQAREVKEKAAEDNATDADTKETKE